MAHPLHARSPPLPGYRPRRPEQTLLHQTVRSHWPAFRARADEHGGLPRFVVREVEDYLDCGVLSRGCVVQSCGRCGYAHVVGLSCKHRGFCPSCCGRRMGDVASHSVDAVLPAVPIRQWVCTLPWQLRYAVGYDRQLCGAVFDAFAKELLRSYKRRAKRVLGLRSLSLAHTGTVSFVQRFDSALRLSPHAHTLSLDGVYVRNAMGALTFHPLPEPTLAEVAAVAARTAARIERVLRKLGRYLDERDAGNDQDELALEQPALSACYRAAAAGQQLLGKQPGQPVLRLLASPPARITKSTPTLVAEVRGVNIHAQRAVDGRDRAQLERLCRYLTRPPLSDERLELLPDGRLRLALKTQWSDGTTAVVLHPLDLIARLCALVPPPGFHLTRYAGVLSSHAALRPEVVFRGPADPELIEPQLPLFDPSALRPAPPPEPDPPPPAGRRPWAWLLRRVFRADISVCPSCRGSMKITEVALTAQDIARVLAHHGLGPQPPPRSATPPATPPQTGQLGLCFDS